MAIPQVLTRGYGNGTFEGTIPLVLQRGYGVTAVSVSVSATWTTVTPTAIAVAPASKSLAIPYETLIFERADTINLTATYSFVTLEDTASPSITVGPIDPVNVE